MHEEVRITYSDRLNLSQALLDDNIKAGRVGRPAVYYHDKVYTYGDILEMSCRFGDALAHELGIGIEDRIMLILKDSPEFLAVFLGSIRIGAVAIPVNTMLTPADYRYMINLSRCKVLVVDCDLLDLIREVRPGLKYVKHFIAVRTTEAHDFISYEELVEGGSRWVEPADTHKDDAAFWLWTSGTTGTPQAVIHLHHDGVFVADTYGKHVLKITEEDRCFSASKLFFAYGLDNSLFYTFRHGASCILYPEKPRPEELFRIIKKNRPTIFYSVPSMYNAMLQVAEKLGDGEIDLSSLRLCVSAGEALPAPIYWEWKRRFNVDILDGMGSTEILGMALSNRPGKIKPGSSGLPVPGCEAKVVDEDGNEVKVGEAGYLMVKADSTTPYYWLNHEKSKKRIVGEWIYTGDIYKKDEDGFFWYLGRADDMIKHKGVWVSPIEVESILLENHAVKECAVVGVKDEVGLNVIKAFIVLKEEYKHQTSMEDIIRFAKQRLPSYKVPRIVQFVDELPKTATGKIRRFILRGGR